MMFRFLKKGKPMIKMGARVRDNITGFEGIVIGRSEWMHGCARCAVQSNTLKDGVPIDAEWFDDQRLEVIEELPVKVSKDSSATSGGPQKDAPLGRSVR